MNELEMSTVNYNSSFNENILTVSFVGSALGADKKINLASRIFFIVIGDTPAAARPSTQGRPADVRSYGLHLAHGQSLARLAGSLWAVEFGLYAVAALVSARPVATPLGRAGAPGARQATLSGRQPC